MEPIDNIDPDKFLAQNDDQYRAMFNFYKNNPALAATDLLRQDLAPLQTKIINGNLSHLFCINVLSRGSGKTRMMGNIAALEAMFNPKKKVGFLGPQFRVARLAFQEFEAIYSESEFLQASVKKISKQPDMWSVEFYNGAFIYAMPLAADSKVSVRGVRLHTALIDEYPHVPKEVLDAVINPMLATQRNPMENVRRLQKQDKMISSGKMKVEDVEDSVFNRNKILAFSSAYFKYNHMYESIQKYKELALKQKVQKGKSDYAIYVFNYKDMPKGFFEDSFIEHARQTTPEIIFRMEYLSEFPSDSDGFFKQSLIDSCSSKAPNSFYLEQGADKDGIYFMGIDPARNHDAFAISIMKLLGNEVRLIRVLSWQKTPFPVLAQEIRKLIRQYNIHLIGMDAGGGGVIMRDLLADPMTAANPEEIILDMGDDSTISRPGKRILKLFDFSPNWIVEANYDMKASMEHKRLMLPDLRVGDTFVKPEFDPNDVNDYMLAEFFSAIKEITSIVLTATKSGVLHFDTEKQSMRKDRYSAILIAHKLVSDYIKEGFKIQELTYGGFGNNVGGIMNVEEPADEWEMGKMIQKIQDRHFEIKHQFDDASLEK